ncbi:hypothetical protein VitviT2T_002687 [Vitis vinifera]|uniref:Protein ENHANCED DISEASE RESISTANCE 2 C-terminal domain-containing protein n=1 Tax=Vitis vinifera TaxID=29760 RepID=A0ABY9BK58_VITVI|nr:hypothetical protein VitviT2T_002687 [Vitis vinifera]
MQAPWMVRRIVGSTPHFLGKVVDCNYIRGPKYLEIDVDFGSSTVVDGALAFVNGAIPNLVVDMAFLVQVGEEWEKLQSKLYQGSSQLGNIEVICSMVGWKTGAEGIGNVDYPGDLGFFGTCDSGTLHEYSSLENDVYHARWCSPQLMSKEQSNRHYEFVVRIGGKVEDFTL